MLALGGFLAAGCGAPSTTPPAPDSSPSSSNVSVSSAESIDGTEYLVDAYGVWLKSPDGRKVPCVLAQSYHGPALSCDWDPR